MPFDAASQTATNGGGFGALSLQTWGKNISEYIDPRASGTGAIRRGFPHCHEWQWFRRAISSNLGEKIISEYIDRRASGPVPFNASSKTATSGGGFGALCLPNLGEKISPKILIVDPRDRCHSTRLPKLPRMAVVSGRYLFKLGRKISLKILNRRASGPVPFDAASQTATNGSGFGALSLRTWEKNISVNIDPRSSGLVPFDAASQTAMNGSGFGALSIQTWEKNISENIDRRSSGTGAIRRGFPNCHEWQWYRRRYLFKLGRKIFPKILIVEPRDRCHSTQGFPKLRRMASDFPRALSDSNLGEKGILENIDPI